MPRIPELTDRASLSAEDQPIFDAIAQSRGRVGPPFSLLLHSPEAAQRVAHLGAYLRFDSTIPAAERELAILTAARESDCNFEFVGHAGLARQAGVREAAIEAVRTGAALDDLEAGEALIVGFGRQLLRDHRVSPETFEAMRTHLGDAALVDLTALLGYYTMLACSLNAFEVGPPAGSPPLP
jgi:4-carboxymuconolactone decarboxylase